MENATPLTCLVLEPVPVVADDLAAMIREETRSARILRAASVEGAAEILQGERLDIAFVNLPPSELAQTDLVKRMEAAGVMVVLMGSRPTVPTRRQRSLEIPFVPRAVARELRAVMRRTSDCGMV